MRRPATLAICIDADMSQNLSDPHALIHMRIGVPAEIRPGETRVAATPETVGKLVRKGRHTCIVQSNAGTAASIPDASFEATGAVIGPSRCGRVFAIRRHSKTRAGVERACAAAARIDSHRAPQSARRGGNRKARGNRRDGLCARSRPPHHAGTDNGRAFVAGQYRWLQGGADCSKRIPAFHAAADDGGRDGEGRPCAGPWGGVAGLQAIATARRLGAVVEAFDVRPAVKEQVESLGARFIEVPVPTPSVRRRRQPEATRAR